MKWLRASCRLKLVSLLTLFTLLVLLLGLLLTIPWPRARARWRSFVFRNWARSLLPVIGVEVQTEGSPPQAPFFLVSNHLSYLDILVLASTVGATFIAKAEIAHWPLVGILCRSMNTIFIDRETRRDIPRVMRDIERQLKLGEGVILFAEGTSSPGATVLPFRPSLLEPAVRAALPVSFAALSYHTREDEAPAHLAVCWWGGMEFPGHLWNFLKLSRISARLVFGEERLRDASRKHLAERLRERVLGCFEPVVDQEEL
jgi:1-acyl-sn-glycerol-3-phosphate acyltransferase